MTKDINFYLKYAIYFIQHLLVRCNILKSISTLILNEAS